MVYTYSMTVVGILTEGWIHEHIIQTDSISTGIDFIANKNIIINDDQQKELAFI
jgi:hypothetical protein